MTKRSQTMAVGMALLLALSVFVPTVAAQETTTVSVQTDAATDVTDEAATLNGNLTELSGADNATVHFEYWVQGDPANSTNTTEMKVGSGTFSWSISGLSNDTTYVYTAHAEANNVTAEGANETFTTLAEAPLGVETLAATDVSLTSATLNGELTGFGGADNATVYFEYWVEGDRNSSTNTSTMTLDETGNFSTTVSGLSPNETYVYVAHAEVNPDVTGDRVSFTPGMNEDSDQPFGHWVSAFVHSLIGSEDSDERNLGQIVSEWVTSNNPGADNRPDHAGPPGDDDGDAESDDDDERGPPDHAGKDKDDDERGPPDHAGKDKDDDSDDDDEDDEDDDDEDDEDDDDDDADGEDDDGEDTDSEA